MIYLNYFGANATTVYNLYIGGVSSVITNATQLASYFSFSASNVTEFATDGDNIKAFINTSYTLNNNAFDNSGGGNDWGNGALVTYFYDADNLMTNMATGAAAQFYNQYNLKWVIANACATIASSCFRNCYSLQKVEFNACTTVSTSFNFNGCYNLRYISIPSCTTLGSNVTADSIFNNVHKNITVITNTTLSTNNGGGPDGDLTYVTGTVGGTVYYRANTTAPSAITNLAIGTTYGTAFSVTFTPPSSTNTILYYEVWVNGVFRSLITGSGGEVVGLKLNTSYDVVVKTVDIYGNKSDSNTATASTNSSYTIPTITSYWQLNSNSNDSVGSNNGSDTSISYVSGGILGNYADFTASTSSKISVADNNSLSFGNGTIDSAFTYFFWVKFSTVGDSMFFSKYPASSTNREYFLRYNGTQLWIELVDQSTGGNISARLYIKLSAGELYCIAMRYNGNGLNTGLSFAVNGEYVPPTTLGSSGSYTAMENGTGELTIGKYLPTTTISLNGYMDEAALFSSAITNGHISDCYDKIKKGTALNG